MARSLKRYGQVSPVVVCRREETLEVVDGFKRLSAARTGVLKSLSCKLLEADERAAKAAIYGLNRAGRQTSELEEAWIVQALVREDGLSQVEAAELLGRHKTWVCRRLALLEKLAPEAREDLRVGLLTPTAARCLTRLPAGNQAEVLATARREGLSAVEMRGVVELLSSTANQSQAEFVLARPREALQQANRMPTRLLDPRLSVCGNRIARQLVPGCLQHKHLHHLRQHACRHERAGSSGKPRGQRRGLEGLNRFPILENDAALSIRTGSGSHDHSSAFWRGISPYDGTDD